MYFACDNKDQNVDTFISMGKRKKSSEVDRAIGKSKIFDSSGFWKDFIGIIWAYVIKYIDDVVFVPENIKVLLIGRCFQFCLRLLRKCNFK